MHLGPKRSPKAMGCASQKPQPQLESHASGILIEDVESASWSHRLGELSHRGGIQRVQLEWHLETGPKRGKVSLLGSNSMKKTRKTNAESYF